jgi:transcriptional regulator with XRE-family HTH domain
MASEHLGDQLARLRRLADLTQEALAERSGVSVDVVRKLEQHRKHSARLPTLRVDFDWSALARFMRVAVEVPDRTNAIPRGERIEFMVHVDDRSRVAHTPRYRAERDDVPGVSRRADTVPAAATST